MLWRRIAGSITVRAMRTSSSLSAALVFLVLASSGCDDKKAKPEETKKVEPTPVPSDMVFNDFLPTTGGPTGVRARDAGSEGGLSDVASGADPSDPNAGAGGGGVADKLKVTEPGADPKAVRKYAFVVGKVDKRILTITQNVTQSAGGQTQPGQEITIKLWLDLTPKAVKKEGATIEAKLTKVDLPGAPPQAATMLASMVGLSGTFEITAHGEAGEVQFAATPQMRNPLAENIIQGLSQAIQLLVAPLPEAAIGAGAKWELVGASRPGEPDQGTKRFSATELSADGGVIVAEIDLKVPRRPQQTKQGTVFLEVDGKGKYTYQTKFNAMATKVDGELTVNEKIEAPPQAGQPKQQMMQTQKVKHSIETPK